MTRFMRLLYISITLLTVTTLAHAQEDIDYEQLEKATVWFADRAEGMLIRFNGLRSNIGELPQKYCAIPDKTAKSLGFALAVATWDEQRIILFEPDGNDVKGRVITRADIPEQVYWESISKLGIHRTHRSDITLSERPLPVRKMNKAANKFEVVIDTEKDLPEAGYNQMIFKPHNNAVRLATKHRDLDKDEKGNVVKDEMQYVFQLKNPAIVSKMFRGYKDNEALPWVVRSSFFNNHSILQFSRWKDGEPIKRASTDAKRIISQYYGGRAIKDTRWVATLESGERTFYAVQFEHKGKDALAALVCIGEGEVTSTWEFHGEADTSGGVQSIWFVDDEGDFMEHAPEIHCMAATNEGLELYVRLFGGESVQYYILREMEQVWMEVQSDIWVYVWD